MLNFIRPKFEKTKQFVKEYPTVAACAATAAVTAYVIHDRDVTILKAIAARALLEADDRVPYLLKTSLDFIENQELTEEFADFATRSA